MNVVTHEPLLCARDLQKVYPLAKEPSDWLMASLLRRLATSVPNLWRQRLIRAADRRAPLFTALEGVGFEIRPGESLGVIGRNGSGKSTLLQLLAGVLQPTAGSLVRRGTSAALLELGSGLNPEFTGRQNLHLLAQLSGVPARDIGIHCAEVEAFAEIGDFIHLPVKTYSSGMVLRLAFAVQTFLRPDLFIVDEAMSVGDVFFQSKCARFFKEQQARGMALVLVTHDLPTVKALCQRTLVLHRGRPIFLGDSTEAVARYHEVNQVRTPPVAAKVGEPPVPVVLPAGVARRNWSSRDEIGSREAELICVEVCDESGLARREFVVGETPRLRFYVEAHQPLAGVHFTFQLSDRHGHVLYAVTTAHLGQTGPTMAPGRLYRCDLVLQQSPGCGDYLVDAGLGLGDRGDGAPLQHLHRVGGIAALAFRPAGPVPAFLGPADYQAEIRWAEAPPA